jgi:hypothetical protein
MWRIPRRCAASSTGNSVAWTSAIAGGRGRNRLVQTFEGLLHLGLRGTEGEGPGPGGCKDLPPACESVDPGDGRLSQGQEMLGTRGSDRAHGAGNEDSTHELSPARQSSAASSASSSPDSTPAKHPCGGQGAMRFWHDHGPQADKADKADRGCRFHPRTVRGSPPPCEVSYPLPHLRHEEPTSPVNSFRTGRKC